MTDLLPKTKVQIRNTMTGAIYKAALSQYHRACLGFILGSRDAWTQPVFDFAVTAVVLPSYDGADYKDGYRQLMMLVPVANVLATEINLKVIGLWAAWDLFLMPNRHQRFGEFIDIARVLQIAYVVEINTDGGESFWAPSIFFAGRFPHNSLSYKMFHHRPLSPSDNPRRIQARWRQLIEARDNLSGLSA